MKREQCFVDASAVDVDAALRDWCWLIGAGNFSLVRATALGDLFVKDTEGRVYFLDTMDGQFRCVAESEQELSHKLDDRANRDKWLTPHLVQLAQLSGIKLAPGQCYSCKTPQLMGGKFEMGNIEACDLIVHLSVLGQLFCQTRESGA